MAEVEREIDAPPAKEQKEEELDVPPENSQWKVYFQGKWATKLLNRSQCAFGFLILFEYLFQMVGYISAANFYSDADRLIPCSYSGDLSNPENASAVYDPALLHIGIFHVISWLRCALLATIMLLSLDLMNIWYITMVSTVYGLVAYIIVFMSYFSEAGEACASAQPNRATFLLVEICCSWLVMLYQFLPFMLCCYKKSTLDERLRQKEEDSEEDED